MTAKVNSLNIISSTKLLSSENKSIENGNIKVFTTNNIKDNIDEVTLSTQNNNQVKEKSDNKKNWLIGTGIALGIFAIACVTKKTNILNKTNVIQSKNLVNVQKSAKFLQRQTDDIAKYGEKNILRENVPDEILDKYTPLRRLSNKPCALSDPKYFIEKFEKNMGKDFLPSDWGSLSEAQKVDYIVKDRYSKIVSCRIMDSIKDENVENLFSLNKSGDIIGYSKGVVDGVGTSIIDDTAIAIHNHPKIWYEDLEYKAAGCPKFYDGHSKGDIGSSVGYNVKSYVVDSLGNKFLFEPLQNCSSTKYNRQQLATLMQWSIDPGDMTLNSAIDVINSNLDKLNLKDFSKLKFEKMSGVFEEQINTIKDFADKGWCKYTIIPS